MRHLFIINPAATHARGRVAEIAEEIKTFFRDMGMYNYDIHVTRWARDGMGFANRYALASPEPVRVHAMGGSGTLYEVVNGVIGLPNVQIAAYPMGNSSFCAQCFGKNKEYMFRSFRNQVFSDVTPIDAMRYENIYSIAHILIGIEAVADRDGSRLMRGSLKLPADLYSIAAAANAIIRSAAVCRDYRVTIDDNDYSGKYISMHIAGTPRYGVNMIPAPDASPNDGVMDIYLMKKMPPLKAFSIMNAYLNGRHKKLSGLIKHVRGKKICVSAEKNFVVTMDGEAFSDRDVSYEIVPAAVDLVCPDGLGGVCERDG